jgi:hypothetical protein
MNEENTGMPQLYEQTEQQTEQQVPQETTAKQVESEKEQNLRYLRERAEMAERRNQELERMIQMNMNQNQPSTKLQLEEEDDFDVSDDTYIEGKHLKKYIRTLKNDLKKTKEQQAEFMRQSTVANAELRLKSQFADFDSVVCKENLEKLSSQKPALFRSIMSNPDIYDQGYTAYEMIKGSGIGQNLFEKQDRRLEENKAKPRASANASPQTSETPLTRVGDFDRRILTKERKDEINRQVELAKSYK